MKEKYIIFTGSFNPVTNAHLFALKTAMKAIGICCRRPWRICWEVLKNGIGIDGKTVVSGHVGAYYGHIKDEHPDWEFDSPDFKRSAQRITSKKEKKYYRPFYGDGVIALDANAYATGFMNCIVLED